MSITPRLDYLTGIDNAVKVAKDEALKATPKPLKAKLIKPAKINPYLHADLFRRVDKGVALRERRLRDLNCQLGNAMSAREISAMIGEGSEYDPITLAPGFGPGKRLSTLLNAATGEKSYASAENMANMGSHYRRVVDMGCHKESNPRTLGRYQTPEVLTVTRKGQVNAQGEAFRLAASYRNQNGNPLEDMALSRTKMTARKYRAHKKAFRKVVQDMTQSIQASREDAETFKVANDNTLTDYRKYFR